VRGARGAARLRADAARRAELLDAASQAFLAAPAGEPRQQARVFSAMICAHARALRLEAE
jgi:hypothetical protein